MRRDAGISHRGTEYTEIEFQDSGRKKLKIIFAYLASWRFRDFLPLRREGREGVFVWACAVHGVLCVLAVKRGDRKSEAGKWVVLDTCSCYAYYRNM